MCECTKRGKEFTNESVIHKEREKEKSVKIDVGFLLCKINNGADIPQGIFINFNNYIKKNHGVTDICKNDLSVY